MVLTQIGTIVAFGVLLDTALVRSVLVPALFVDLGDRVWWPSKLAKRAPVEAGRRLGPSADAARRGHSFDGRARIPRRPSNESAVRYPS